MPPGSPDMLVCSIGLWPNEVDDGQGLSSSEDPTASESGVARLAGCIADISTATPVFSAGDLTFMMPDGEEEGSKFVRV